jgi:hypothetical protein
MSLTADPRYDVRLIDSPDGGATVVEELPLILNENAGRLDITTAMSSPFGGRVVEGDLQDADNSRYQVITQRDWRGGLGQEFAYEDPSAFLSGVAETRFRNQLMLPPEVRTTAVGASTDPQFLPSQPGVVVGSKRVSAKWTKRNATDEETTAQAVWTTGTRTNTETEANAIASQQTLQYTTTAASSSVWFSSTSVLARAKKFTTGYFSFTITQLEVWLARTASASGAQYRVSIRADSGGVPSGSMLWSSTGTDTGLSASPTFTTVSFSLSLPVSANTSYWIVCEWISGSQVFEWKSSNADGLETLASWNGSSWTLYTDQRVFFRVNGGANIDWAKTRVQLAQSFVCHTAVSVTQVQLLIRASVWGTSPTVQLLICSDSSGLPNTSSPLRTVSISNPGTSETWVTLTFSSLALSASTTYWLVLNVDVTGSAHNTRVQWQRDSGGAYPHGSAWARSFTGDAAGSWTVVTGDFYFIVGATTDGMFFTRQDYSRVQLAQSFVAPSSSSYTQVLIPIRASAWGTSPTVQLLICSDSSGAPNLSSPLRTVSISNPGTVTNWVTLTFSSLALSASTTYWLVLNVDVTGSAHNTQVQWLRDQGGGYASGVARSRSGNGYTFGTWSSVTGDFYFIVGAQASGNPYHYTHTFSRAAYAVWVQPTAAVTLTQVRLYIQYINWQGSPTLTFTVRNDSANTPGGTVLGSAVITLSAISGFTSPGWLTLSVSASLSAGTKYHLCIEPDAATEASAVEIDWLCDNAGNWSGQGSEGLSTVPGAALSWTGGQIYDFFFILNNGTSAPAEFTVQPVRHGNSWYAAAGTTIYRFNTTTNTWDVVNTAGAAVTAMASFAGKIYAALGDSTDMIESTTGNSGTWSATAGNRRYTFLCAYGNGFLHAAKSVGGANALAYTNGTQWTTDITVGDSTHAITGLAGFQNELMIATSKGLMSLSSAYVYTAHNYLHSEHSENGRGLLTWMADGRLYVPIRQGLGAYDGVRMTPSGPDLEEGLPLGQLGRIASLVGTPNWLFAAIDAGTSGTSGVYAYNGVGWHCLALATTAGRRIRAMGLEGVTSSIGLQRLWFFEDTTPCYIELPSLSDNPRGVTGMRYATSGVITSAKMGGQLALIQKDFNAIALWTEGCSANQRVEVYYEVDDTELWTMAGTVTRSPYQEIRLPQSQFVTKTVASGSTALVINVLSSDTLSDLSPGEFVRIGSEVAQVRAINSLTQFTLALPLTAAPPAGATIYPSGPAGRQIRYRLQLFTNDPAKTPLVLRVSVRLQGQVLVKRRISMGVRVEDDMKCRTGAPYPYSAAELRKLLYEWMQRLKAFWIVQPDGLAVHVKPAAGMESGLVRTDLDHVVHGRWRFKSQVRIDLDEV